MIQTYPIKYVSKPWGGEEWLVNNSLYCAKRLLINPGGWASYHYHRIKHETFLVEEGRVRIRFGDADKPMKDATEIELTWGQSFVIHPGMRHSFGVPAEYFAKAIILEVSTHHDDEDVVRMTVSQIIGKS